MERWAMAGARRSERSNYSSSLMPERSIGTELGSCKWRVGWKGKRVVSLTSELDRARSSVATGLPVPDRGDPAE